MIVCDMCNDFAERLKNYLEDFPNISLEERTLGEKIYNDLVSYCTHFEEGI